MKRINSKNLQKLVPFAAAVFVLAFVTAGCENVMLQKLLRNPHKKPPPQPVVDTLGFDVVFTHDGDEIPATRSQIYPDAKLVDYVVKVPYGTTSGTVKGISVKASSEDLDFTLSPSDGKMALPSKKPVTITVPEAGKSPKVYSVYFVVCPEAYYVAAYGDDRNPGDTKERPFRQLKTALDAASNSRVVNKVVVVGKLTKDNAAGLIGGTHTFNLDGYGLKGFAPIGVTDNFTPPTNADVWNKIGSITVSGMDGATLQAAPNKGVMKITGNSYLTFENITFTRGYIPGTDNAGGGGLNIENSGSDEIEIRLLAGTRVIDNEILYHANGKRGGGIYVTGSKLTIIDAEISRNKSGDAGGGIYADNATVLINSSLISANTAEVKNGGAGLGSGGGIYISGAALTATECVFAGNTAAYTTDAATTVTNRGGGGVYLAGGSTFTAASCNFTANTASITSTYTGVSSLQRNGGGAVYVDSDNHFYVKDVSTFTAFTVNTATITSSMTSGGTSKNNGGGAIFVGRTTSSSYLVEMQKALPNGQWIAFIGNTATVTGGGNTVGDPQGNSGGGSALYGPGALSISNAFDVLVSTGNSATVNGTTHYGASYTTGRWQYL